MKISLNKIKQYAKIPPEVSDQALVDLIGSRLVEVEEVIDLAPAYQNIFIVKVMKAAPIEGTHLHLCEIDAGAQNANFDQLENGLVQVVCGAPNVRAGMLAVWIAPGAIVPETYGGENFKIGARKLCGYMSNGMLAGADELGFSDEHKAIAEIDPSEARPGDSFAEVFGLNDIILDVENKSLTHRPDCFGLIGFAREVAGILGQKFDEPEIYRSLEVKLQNPEKLKLAVKIEDTKLCPRYSCAVFDLQEQKPSKYLTKQVIFLNKAGMRAISPMVDLTNILMLETGQPLHAFDYDKLVTVGGGSNAQIIVRAAEEGERLQLLDGKTIECTPDDILITSDNVPVALAGAMGGKNTEIDASTKRVVLESATFSLYHLRKTQMAHGIFSEAITRFTKGQPAAQALAVLKAALDEMGAKALAVIDEYPQPEPKITVETDLKAINGLLGTEYSLKIVVDTLENVGFEVKIDGKMASKAIQDLSDEFAPQNTVPPQSEARGSQKAEIEVLSPLWRTDIHIEEDIIEEVGRLLGYDNIVPDLPKRPFLEAKIDPILKLKDQLRNILSDKLDMHEVLTYSFVSRRLLQQVEQNPEESYKIINSISPELQCFRQQIVPSLLSKVRENLKAGYHDFAFYELNQVTSRKLGLSDDGVPEMQDHLGIVMLADFYHLKAKVLEMLKAELGVKVEYNVLAPGSKIAQEYPYLEPGRAIEVRVNGCSAGACGEVEKSVRRSLKITEMITAAELNLPIILDAPIIKKHDIVVSRYPAVERDLTLRVGADAPFGRFYERINQVMQAEPETIFKLEPLSIYQAEADSATKNLSFRLKFSDLRKTLAPDEISGIMERIIKEIRLAGAEVI